MGEWLDAYGDIETWYVIAKEANVAYLEALLRMTDHVGSFWEVDSWTKCNVNFDRIFEAFKDLKQALYINATNEYSWYGTPFDLEGIMLTKEIGDEAEVDWKAICKAWWDAPLAGWGWTIQLIDFMRQGIWDEPEDIINQESFMD